MIAERSIREGAWIAPANQPLRGVVALDPRLADEAARSFFAQQLNLVTQVPRGFLVLSAQTLTADRELRELSVRRLLILLRRLALRDGLVAVFEPNDERFRGRMRRQFEQLMSDLHARGAFAGATPRELLAARLPDGGGWSADGLPSVQDEPAAAA